MNTYQEVCEVCKQQITDQTPYVKLEQGVVHQGVCQSYLTETINEKSDDSLLSEVKLLN